LLIRKMVGREGSAPSTSGCKPDMMLLHHRAETGYRGWICTTTNAFKGRCPAIKRPGKKLMEPEVVATSPCRIKSPVPVCCGFGSIEIGGRGESGLPKPSKLVPHKRRSLTRKGVHSQGSQTLDLWGLLFPLNHSPEKKKWYARPDHISRRERRFWGN
jgi:hypothetical protein